MQTEQASATTETAIPSLEGAPVTDAVTTNVATTEATDAPSKETTVEEKLVARKFADLVRKNKSWEVERKELQTKLSKVKEYEERDKRFRESPEEMLKHYGYEDFETLAKSVVDGKKPESLKIRELERRIEEKERQDNEKAAKNQEAESQRAIDNYVSSLKKAVESQPEKYELINEFDMSHKIWDTIKAHHEETGEALTWETAADKVENELFDFCKNLKSQKIRKIFTPQEIASKADQEKKTQSKTLTNELSSQPTSPAKANLSRDEEVSIAARMLQSSK